MKNMIYNLYAAKDRELISHGIIRKCPHCNPFALWVAKLIVVSTYESGEIEYV